VVAIGFEGPQGLQDLLGPRDQKVRRAIPASPDQQVPPDQQVKQAPKVLLAPGDPRGLLEILHNKDEAA